MNDNDNDNFDNDYDLREDTGIQFSKSNLDDVGGLLGT